MTVVRRTAEVIIIGGGVTGTSVAFHLARRGVARVVVLERRFLAAGGTGHSVGIIRQLYPNPEACRMVLHSLRVFQNFPELVGGESGYVGCGALISVSPALLPSLRRSFEIQQAIGISAELLKPGDLGRVEPRIDVSGLGAVLYEPESGYGDPTAVTLGYAAAARDRGVAIEQGVAVTAIQVQGERVAGVVTQRGESIASRTVINAAGLWAGAVASLAGVALPIVVGRHPVFIIKRGAGFGPGHPVYLDLAGGTYARPETGDLTLTGSLTEDERRHPMDPDLLGSEAGFEEAASALEKTSRAFPALADCQYQQGYAGAFDITPDWMPILDESPVRGFFVAAGMSGHGFKLAPAVGEMLAQMITGKSPTIDPTPFSLARFRDVPATASFVSSYVR